MRIWAERFLFAAIIAVAAAPPAAADAIVIGAPGNAVACVPFGCRDASRYQQIYAGALFGGVFSVDAIAFPFTLYRMSNLLDPADYHIRLATTQQPVGSANANFDANVGADATLVFDGQLSGEIQPGGQLSFALAAPFVFDPRNGNLILDVIKTGGSFFGDDGIYLDFNSTMDGRSSSLWPHRDGVLVSFPVGGLVTAFSGHEVAPVPEPSTLLLLGSGLAGFMARRRRQAASAR